MRNTNTTIKNVCVFSSSSNHIADIYFNEARELGRLIGKNGFNLVYGGGNIGLMGTLAEAVRINGGKITGVIPNVLKEKELAYEEADELIVTNDMRERKKEMEVRADCFIALPGGFGTLEEILEIITLKQLQLNKKPVIFINTMQFYEKLIAFFEHLYLENFAKNDCRELYCLASNAKEAVSYIKTCKSVCY